MFAPGHRVEPGRTRVRDELMDMPEHRPWPEAGQHGAELADVRRELAHLAEKRADVGLTVEEQRRHRVLTARESELSRS